MPGSWEAFLSYSVGKACIEARKAGQEEASTQADRKPGRRGDARIKATERDRRFVREKEGRKEGGTQKRKSQGAGKAGR